MERWNIGIVSTDYDLKEERAIIAKLLEQFQEINVIAFERTDYPVNPHVHSHDACLSAIDLMDIAFVIINQRFGGIYIGNSEYSITGAEIEKLYISNKIVIPIVNKKAWDERHRFFSAFKAQNNSDMETFGLNYNFSYVENYRVIELLEKIHKSPHDNFCIFYNFVSDLENAIIGRLRGLTRFFCTEIMHRQNQQIKEKRTLFSLDYSMGDMFKSGLYISPSVNISSRASRAKHSELLEDVLQHNLTDNKKTLLLGEPGAGKSTALAKAFVESCDNISQHPNLIPVFVQFKEKTITDAFSLNEFYSECFERYYNKPLFPFCDFTQMSFYVFLDGLDELGESLDSKDLLYLSATELLRYPVVLSCRLKFAYSYFGATPLGDIFDQMYTIEKWNYTKARAYIKNFCKAMPNDARKEILAISDSRQVMSMLNNPLITNLVLLALSEGKFHFPFSTIDQSDTIKYAITILADREVARHNYTISSNELLNIWSYIAWLVYRSRGNSENVYIEDVIEHISSSHYSLDKYLARNIIVSIFEVNSVKKNLTGCIHEQILEFLVASYLLKSTLEQELPYPEYLALVIRPEINRLIIAQYNTLSKSNRTSVYNYLSSYYKELLFNDARICVMKRVRAVYYLTRMKNDLRDSFIRLAQKAEQNNLVRISLYSGCIKFGDLESERMFYNELITNHDLESLYMGYHLIYYGDATEETIPFPYYDDSKTSWSETLSFLIQQFLDPNCEHFYMTRIELYIIRRFAESRTSLGSLSPEKQQLIRRCVLKLCEINRHRENAFCNLILKELNLLERLYGTYSD